MRRAASLAVVVGLGLLGCGDVPPTDLTAVTPRPRVVLLISIDTLRPDHLGAYGYERFTSPVIDEIAREGVVFDDVTSTAAWTLPSHTSLLTGLYPRGHGVTGFETALPDTVPTLAGILRAAGWRTGAVVNVEWLRKENYKVTRDFDLYSWAPASLERRSANRWVTDQAIDWIEAAGEEPIFVFAHYYDVHSDYKADPAYEKLFLTPYDGIADGTGWQLKRVTLPEAYFEFCRQQENAEGCRFSGEFEVTPSMEKLHFSEADLRHTRQLYDAQIRQLDAEMARLFTHLRRLGVFDETLLVLTSDHGEEFMEHGSMEHFYTAYQEAVHVPLIMRGPGIPPDTRIATPVSLVDVLPTVLAAVGVRTGVELDGDELLPLLEGGDDRVFRDRPLFVEAPGGASQNRSTGNFFPVYRAVRKGRYKLVLEETEKRQALYDLSQDPGEQVDVSEREPEVLAELMAIAEERYAAPGSGHESAVQLDAESLERLRALGYVP